MDALTGIDRLAPLPAPGLDADAEAERITRASGSSFSLGMGLLPEPRRRAMWALYAFSRVIDDIADEDWPLREKHRLLDAWRGEVDALYAGRPVSAVGRALATPVARFELPRAEFILLIEGMQMDADGPPVAPPLAELRRYTRRVAGAVGMLSMRIFDAWRGAVSARFALALADALQLTNILRDVEEDARLGRLYLPAELLERHGLPADPARIPGHPALPALARDLGRLARAEFDMARAAIPAHRRLALTAALPMMGAYEATLNAMDRAGWARPAPRPGKTTKLAAGLTCLLAPSALRPATG
jgi:phytoene synthase